MKSKQLIFIHIPKAAGQTINSIVARQYPRRQILHMEGRLGKTQVPSVEDASQAKIFLGHLHYGFHEHLQGASTYVTVVREPVSRVLSLYRYIATNPQHHLHEQVMQGHLTDFVSGQIDAEEVENGQTRQIAGVTEGTPDASSLARAKQNLQVDFAVVGVVERFDESIILFKRRLGWRVPFYVRKNVTPKLLAEEAPDEALEIIRRRNTLDAELYRFTCNLLDDQLRDEGPLFDVEVLLFQALNAAARVWRGVRG